MYAMSYVQLRALAMSSLNVNLEPLQRFKNECALKEGKQNTCLQYREMNAHACAHM